MNKVLSAIVQSTSLPTLVVCATVGFMGNLYGTYSAAQIVTLCLGSLLPMWVWLIANELYKTEKISFETKNVIQILGLGTITILYVGRAMYYYRLAYRTGDPLDVVLWGMAVWLALIFMTLIYAQLKKPKKEEQKEKV